jgi:bacteriorhodopsin
MSTCVVRPARSLLRPVFRGTLASLAVMACPVSLHVSGCPACGGLATRCRYTQAFWLRPVAWLLNTPPHGH